METKISTATIIRTIVLFISLVNMILAAFGKSPLPVAEEQISLIVATIATVASALWAWWKNNSFTKAAIKADAVMAEMKAGGDNGIHGEL